jgi:ADP-ribose pyrophosphatase YjhB (NUDIX family)
MSLLTSAVAAVIVDPAGRVLLCQQSQGHRLWGLPGGKIRNGESPVHAVIRDVREETGAETEIADLVGIYHLSSNGSGPDLPDLLVYTFRGRVSSGDIAVNSPGRICRLSWHDGDALPEPLTATARAAIADALAGRSGMLRDVHRDAEPEVPDAIETAPAAATELTVAAA